MKSVERQAGMLKKNHTEKLENTLKKVYLKLRKSAIQEYDKKNYEMSVKYIKTLSRLMYTYNLKYNDIEMEELLNKISKNCFHIKKYTADEKKVLFIDTQGMDRRGLSLIYVDALAELGYTVIYVTENINKSNYSRIERIVKKSNGCVYIVNTSEQIKKANRMISIVKKEKPSKMLLHTFPDDTANAMVYYACDGIAERYRINLTDHAFWIGTKAMDYLIEFRNLGGVKSVRKRKIPKEKLLLLPYYPSDNSEVKFKGFSFDSVGKRIIYTGGSTYKLNGSELWFKIIKHILDKYDDTIVYYNGNANDKELINWIKSNGYTDRFIYEAEREDFEEVMKRCYVYVNTYPVSGGLMTQYAVKNGKIPISLVTDVEGMKQLFIDPKAETEFLSDDYNKIIEYTDKILSDENELIKCQEEIKDYIIKKEDFEEGLRNVLENKYTKYKLDVKQKDTFDYKRISLERGVQNDSLLISMLDRYISGLAFSKFKLLYINYKVKEMLKNGGKNAGN